MKTAGNLGRAIAKLEHMSGREWGGYLTPSEILALENAKARPTYPPNVDRAKEKAKKGDNQPNWAYFEIREGTDLHSKLKERK